MPRFFAKVAVATLAIGAVVALAASQLWPRVPLWQPLLVFAAVMAALVLAALVYAAIAGNIRQWLFRHGAIDPEWLWMPDDPEGFKRQWRPWRTDAAPADAQKRSSRR